MLIQHIFTCYLPLFSQAKGQPIRNGNAPLCFQKLLLGKTCGTLYQQNEGVNLVLKCRSFAVL
jgi:hypothetical protein